MHRIELKSLDMYQCQALVGEPGKVYVRKGKCFVYIGEQRYEVLPLDKEDEWKEGDVAEKVKTVNVDFSKDFTYEGTLRFHQNSEGWIFGISNPSDIFNPLVVLRLEERPTIN